MYIEFCKCHRRLLTTGQMKKNELCELCQEEQKLVSKEEFNERVEAEQ